nr:MAG TPA: hypothetical protein [Caudoviricetes sp.]
MRGHGSNCYKKRLLLHRHTVHRRHIGRSVVVIGTI